MNSPFLIWPMTDEPFCESTEWLNAFLPKDTFPGCQHSRSLWEPSVDVSELGENVAISFLGRVGFQIVRDDLKCLLEPELTSSSRFEQGQLILNGSFITGFQTLRDSHPVTLRGGNKSYCYHCPSCHQVIYTCMGSWYVLADDLPQDSICGSNMGGLIVCEDIASRISELKWKKVSIKPLPVRTKPADGFPANLEEITPEQERVLTFMRQDNKA